MALLPPLSSCCLVLSVGRTPETLPTSVDLLEVCPTSAGAWSALRSGRRFSGVLAADADAELVEAATAAGVPVLSTLDDAHLVAVPDPGWGGTGSALAGGDAGGRLVAVCGTGGTGASTLAAAVAARGAGILGLVESPQFLHGQWGVPGTGTAKAGGMSDLGGMLHRGGPAEHDERADHGGRVLLADFALRAEQAYLHRLGEPAYGLLDLVAMARVRPLTDEDVRRGTHPVAGYRLLTGLRRPAHWTAVAPDAFDVVFDGLRRRFELVVADVTGEFEDEPETGSADVADRNHMARRTAASADVVLAVGRCGAAGRRRLAALVDDLLDHGVEPARIQPVAGDAESVTDHPVSLCGLPALPVPVPWRRGPHGAASAGDGLEAVVDAVALLVAQLPRPDRAPRLARVEPGALGCALS